jgi:hypothetical protein
MTRELDWLRVEWVVNDDVAREEHVFVTDAAAREFAATVEHEGTVPIPFKRVTHLPGGFVR